MIDKEVAIITGASRGIGKAIARRFAREGMAVVLAARKMERLEKTGREIQTVGGFAPLAVQTDLRDADQIKDLVKTTLQEWGRIDVLVNNAGVLYNKPLVELTWEEYREMMAVNMDAVFLLTREVIPHMIARKQGTIINIASLAGKNAVKGGTGYCATKWALRGFATSLMLEVRQYNIRVITIFPGSVDTPMLNGSATAPRRDSMLQPEDIAHAAFAALSVPPRAMMSEIDLRPSNPKR